VPKGRKDGRISMASETKNYQLPPSTFPNYSKASPKEVFL
jgi:hypothetical protein